MLFGALLRRTFSLMGRIFVLGYELPLLATGAVEARSYRTWQFVDPLLADLHSICLVVSHQDDVLDVDHPLGSQLSYHRVNMRRRGWQTRVRALHDAFKPDAVLAVTFNNCVRVTRLATDRPIWMDIYGDKLAEVQLAEHTQQSSRGHLNMMRYLRLALRHGDVFSACSTPQKFALVGELGMVARLNRHTLGYDFVHTILPGSTARPDDRMDGPALRGTKVPQDAFVALWCGGYNVWTDVDTLFKALNDAMSCEPRLVFVSVGASTVDTPDNPYRRLLAQIENSPHQGRFHMFGWRPAGEIPAYYRQADVGVALDAFHYETLLGTRTRLTEMMGYGLPVITSLGCELSYIIRDQELGLVFPIGDHGALCDHLVTLAGDSSRRQGMAERARAYTTQRLSFAETTRPFRDWVQQPAHAPDRAKAERAPGLQEIEYYLRYLARGLLWRLWALERGD
jgi:glycosyltransferase involved in cell wall biosynthesis